MATAGQDTAVTPDTPAAGGGGLLGVIAGIVPPQMQDTLITTVGGPQVAAFYNGLGESEKGMLREMLTTDPAFMQAMVAMKPAEGAAGAEGAQANPLADMPPGLGNVMIRQLHGDPAFRAEFIAVIKPAAPETIDPVAAATGSAAKVAGLEGPQQEEGLMGMLKNIDGKNILGSTLNMVMQIPLVNMIAGFIEKLIGKPLGEFLGMPELMVQSSDPAGLGPAGQTLAGLMDPQALLHMISPNNEVTPVPAGQAANPAAPATTPAPGVVAPAQPQAQAPAAPLPGG